jgi:UrcA family protein
VRAKMSLVLAVMMALASAASHGAAPAGALRQRVVNYSDLNLGDGADAATLYQRITHAAYQVCSLPIPWDAYSASRVRTCIHAARARSVSEVNSPELTRYYESLQPSRAIVAMSGRQP